MLKKATINWTGKTLTNMVNKDNVKFDCAVQRGMVWDDEKKSLLIHSMIEGYPIPPFYFAKDEGKNYIALDGKQRCNAISSYMNEDFALHANTPSVMDENFDVTDIAGKYFSELTDEMQDAIRDYNLSIVYFDGITDEEVSEMFFRINNGKPLSAVELTRVRAICLKEFQSIAAHEAIQTAISEKGKIKYNDENTAMQIWAAIYCAEPDFSTKVFRPLIENTSVSEVQSKAILDSLDYVLALYNSFDLEDKEDKKVFRKVKARTHIVSCAYAAHKCIENNVSKSIYVEMMHDFFNPNKGNECTVNSKYNCSIGAGSARGEKVRARLAVMDELVKCEVDEATSVAQ